MKFSSAGIAVGYSTLSTFGVLYPLHHIFVVLMPFVFRAELLAHTRKN